MLAPRGELEAAVAGRDGLVLDALRLPELPTDGWPLGMAVKVEEAELADALAAALAELKQDGTLAAIFARYGITHLPA